MTEQTRPAEDSGNTLPPPSKAQDAVDSAYRLRTRLGSSAGLRLLVLPMVVLAGIVMGGVLVGGAILGDPLLAFDLLLNLTAVSEVPAGGARAIGVVLALTGWLAVPAIAGVVAAYVLNWWSRVGRGASAGSAQR